jgi:hypothetical protein
VDLLFSSCTVNIQLCLYFVYKFAACKAYKVYKVCKVCKVYKAYKVYKVCKVCFYYKVEPVT